MSDFKEARESKGLTMVEVTDILRIGQNYIEAIEDERYEALPERVYAVGFIKSYAEFLGLDVHEAIAEYNREVGEESHCKEKEQTSISFRKKRKFDFFKNYRKRFQSLKISNISVCNIAYAAIILTLVAVIVDVWRAEVVEDFIDKERVFNMKLVTYPDPILSQTCTDVVIGDPLVKDALQKMSEKLYEWDGAGLAAPQVGIAKKMVVIDVRDEEGNPSTVYKMVNPKIVWKSDEMAEAYEGCLSLPFLREIVKRHESVSVEYLDENFVPQKISKATGVLSRCIQHELDHLQGKLYIDRLSRLKRSRALEEYKKLQQQAAEENAEK